MVRRARRDGLSVAVMSKVSGFSVGLTTLVSAFCRFHARASAAAPGKAKRIVTTAAHIAAATAPLLIVRAATKRRYRRCCPLLWRCCCHRDDVRCRCDDTLGLPWCRSTRSCVEPTKR